MSAPADTAEYALRLGDDALILAQRLAEWTSRAPDLEEDIALTNIALDLLGQARGLLTIAGERDGTCRTEDDLAFLRSEREFRNVRLVEQPNGDYAATIVRQLLFSTYQRLLYAGLSHSADDDLSAIAAKAAIEVRYHCDHAAAWTVRLGDGTTESRQRTLTALDRLRPFTAELFETDELTERLVAAGIAADPASLRPAWEAAVAAILAEATLPVPELGARQPTGGRTGAHGEELGHLLAEMQWLHRAHPGATW